MAFQESVTARNARLDSLETTLGLAPLLLIFTGAEPASTGVADPAGTLATITLPSDWMSAASAGAKAKLGTWSGTATAGAAATAASWRIKDSTNTTCHLQGNSTDMTFDGAITSGQTITVNTFTITAGNS